MKLIISLGLPNCLHMLFCSSSHARVRMRVRIQLHDRHSIDLPEDFPEDFPGLDNYRPGLHSNYFPGLHSNYFLGSSCLS